MVHLGIAPGSAVGLYSGARASGEREGGATPGLAAPGLVRLQCCGTSVRLRCTCEANAPHAPPTAALLLRPARPGRPAVQ